MLKNEIKLPFIFGGIFMKRPIRIVLAVILIIILYILWMGLGSALFGWKHGGGTIPIMLFLALAIFLWKAITKKTPEEKDGVKNNISNNEPKMEDSDK
jgi:CHASE2 domain-containing sensor protein